MLSDNEAAIGLLRGAGSAKPEFFVLRDVAKFVAEIRPWLKKREPEPALLVIPHSNMFSVRNTATDATKRAVRAMVYHCGIPMRSVSEYTISTLKDKPQLIIVPSPQILKKDANSALRALNEAGSMLVLSGPFIKDENWMPNSDLAINVFPNVSRLIAQEEVLAIDGAEYVLSYRGEKIQRLEKLVTPDGDNSKLSITTTGNGKSLFPRVPVELADNIEATVALYKYALKTTGITPVFTTSQFDPTVLVYPAVYQDAVLFTIVSEGGKDSNFKLTLKETNTTVDVALKAQRTTMILMSRKDGRILGRYN
jgi:hypothetical protein